MCKSKEALMKTIHTKHAPAAIGPYSRALDLGSMVIVSGPPPAARPAGR